MNERVIFEAALEIPDPATRKAFVDKACADDPELHSRVVDLLKSHESAGSFLELPVIEQHPPQAPGVPAQTVDFPPEKRPSGVADDDLEHDAGPPDVSFLQPSDKPGSSGTLGHYEVLEILGHGGFGIVFKGFDEKLQRLVAIKVLNPQMAATSPPRKRFLREARAAAAMRHENIVQVYSVEEQPLPYLVMEYIQGQTLQQKLNNSGPLDVIEVLHIGRQIANGLVAAHAIGLIHRDIKPGNILIEQGFDPRVKITDFGLARAADDASLTRTGAVSGTPMYMAPEQATGQPLDHRADLFSLGSVLYVLACGRPPFRAANAIAVLRRVTEDTPRPLQEIIPEIPDWLVAIVTKLHAKNPEDRFQTAKEVADLLARCQSELQLNGKVTCVPVAESLPSSNKVNDRPATSGAANTPASQATSTPVRSESSDQVRGLTPSGSPFFSRGRLLAAATVVLILVAAILFQRANQTKFEISNLKSQISNPPGQAESTDSTNPDRRAAEWVLLIGGTITIKENGQARGINAGRDLPDGAFELTQVQLAQNSKVSEAGLAHFKDCKNLTYLDLGGTQASDAGLANFKDCKNLTVLQLGVIPVTDAGLAHFKDCKNLTVLNLYATMVTDAGLVHVKDCQNLTNLYLHNTQVTDAGLAHFVACPKLASLIVSNTKVTEAGVKNLSAALPGCKIEWDGGVIEPRTGWHGWSADAPPPAIAPFDAEQHQAAWAKYLNVPVEYTNSLGMKFRLIPPGEFTMGSTSAEIEEALKEVGTDKRWQAYLKSEIPQHKVILTRPIYLGVHEVTQGLYEQMMGKNPSHFAPMGIGKEAVAGMDNTSHPVEVVTWNDAAEFCAKLSQYEKHKPFYFRSGQTVTPLNGTGYRLPTEAEWEFACRAGTTTNYWIGDNDKDLMRCGWFSENSGGRTHPVGELKPNPFGVYDIQGNVGEWIQDWWEPTYYGQVQGTSGVDPSGPSSAGSLRVIRGSDFRSSASGSRAALRNALGPEVRDYYVGFRVVFSVDAVKHALKVDGPKTVKPAAPVGANGKPIAEPRRSAWDDLDPAQIPEVERVPRQPEGLVAVLGQHRQRVWNVLRSASSSPDGTQFTLTTDDGLYLFGRDPKQPARFFNFDGVLTSATILPDGRVAAFVDDRGMQLQIFAKPRDGMPLEKLSATSTNTGSVIHYPTVSSDGRWLAGWEVPDNIALWKLGDATPQRSAKFTLSSSHGNIWQGSFSPDAHWFCVTDNRSVQSAVHLIDLRGDTPREANVLKADADEKTDAPAKGFEHATFLSDGRLATSDRNGRTWFWKINDGEPQRVGSIRAMGLIQAASQSLRLVTNDNNLFRVWNLAVEPPQLLGAALPAFPADNIQNLAISPNGETIFTGHLNKAVRFWNVSAAGVTELDPLVPNPRFHSDYQQVNVIDHLLCASTESARVGIWRPTRNGLQSVLLESPTRWVQSASATQRLLIVAEPSPDGGSAGTALFRCDADRVTQVRRITGNNVHSAALNDEGRRLALCRNNGTDFVAELWGWESDDLPARKLSEIKSLPDRIFQLAFAEAGRTLVGRVGLRVQIWDVKEDQLIPRTILPRPYILRQFAVAPDGHTLATAAYNGLDLWNLKSDLTQPTTSFAISGTGAVAFSPDGRRLAASFWENGGSAGVQIINLASGVVEKRLTFPGQVYDLAFTDDGRHLVTGNANTTIYVVRLEAWKP